jgi:hypothetical protein
MASKLSKFWERTGARLVEFILFPPTTPQSHNDNLETAIRVYVCNMKMIEAICKAFDIECFFILQPLIVTKTPLAPLEQKVLENLKIGPEGIRFVREFYDEVRIRMTGNDHFIDASHVLNGRKQSDFYDLGHTSAVTSPVIGERIAHMVLIRVETKDQHALISSPQKQASGAGHH